MPATRDIDGSSLEGLGASCGAESPSGARQSARSGRRYEISDRRCGGYCGRWRYRIRLSPTSAVLFKRRDVAADFGSWASLRGPQHAADMLGQCGYRGGEDFKAEATTSEPAATPQPTQDER